MQKKLEDLDLLDDFLIFTLVNHPEFGEEFSRELLKIILGREFGKLKVVPQKVYYGNNLGKHGARLDVYVEDDVTVCDIEPEKKSNPENVQALPRRVRFYHSKIDSGILKAGEEYTALKNVIVIMIMPFDPFGYDHMIYTICNGCVEVPDMPYDDGARTIFLYTRGKKGNPTKELKELLSYMERSKQENAKNDGLKKIHKMVECVKQEAEVSLAYMRIGKSEAELRREGRQEGLEEGKNIGLISGIIDMANSLNADSSIIVQKLMEVLSVSYEEAEEYIRIYQNQKQEAEVSLAYMRIGKSEAELRREGKNIGLITGIIKMANSLNVDSYIIAQKLMEELNISYEEADEYIRAYRKEGKL